MNLFDKFRKRPNKSDQPDTDSEAVIDPLQPWREIVNREGRFHLSSTTVHDGNGMPYNLVHPASGDATEAHTFRAIALCLTDRGNGAILCHPDWNPGAGKPDHLSLSLGELVEFLMTWRLESQPLKSNDWGAPGDHGLGIYSEPDTLILPIPCRMALERMMSMTGVDEPLVALYTNSHGKKSLYFSGWGAILTGETNLPLDTLGGLIVRCLPRHYHVVLNEPNPSDQVRRQRWFLRPSGAHEGDTTEAHA